MYRDDWGGQEESQWIIVGKISLGRGMMRGLSSFSTLIETWRALAALRRALPIALVFVAMVSAEWVITESVLTLLADVVLFAAFVFLMPAAWRVAVKSRAVGLAGYFALAVAIVVVFGFEWPRALGLSGTYVVADGASLGVVLVLMLVGGWGLGRDIELEAGLDAEHARAERLALSAEHARLLAMRAQLDPHFLFNTLNAIGT